jgi:16S rRNA (guanine966-N2)-methyltransferase
MGVKIIAGKYQGFLINVPGSARPTLVRTRQSLFDILESLNPERTGFFSGKIVLDCFAGSGAFGFESLSRGAEHAYFVDSSREATFSLRMNAKKMKVEDFSTIIYSDIKFLKKCGSHFNPCNIAFLDPPYGKISIANVLECLLHNNWTTKNTIIITKERKIEQLNKYQEIASRTHGSSIFRILETKDIMNPQKCRSL